MHHTVKTTTLGERAAIRDESMRTHRLNDLGTGSRARTIGRVA